MQPQTKIRTNEQEDPLRTVPATEGLATVWLAVKPTVEAQFVWLLAKLSYCVQMTKELKDVKLSTNGQPVRPDRLYCALGRHNRTNVTTATPNLRFEALALQLYALLSALLSRV